jgi:hypothetical protein
MHLKPGLLALAGLLTTTQSVPAQAGAIHAGSVVKANSIGVELPSNARKGLWFGAGLGTGAGSMHCGICTHEREQGGSGYVRFGTTLNRKMLVGLEGSAWQRTGEAGRRRLVSLTGGAWWYPNPRHGYYLRWGAGVSRWRASEEEQAVTSQALALIVGAGYEIRLNPVLSIVPYLNVLGSSKGSLWLEEKSDVSFERRKLPSGGHAVLFQVGVGITRH